MVLLEKAEIFLKGIIWIGAFVFPSPCSKVLHTIIKAFNFVPLKGSKNMGLQFCLLDLPLALRDFSRFSKSFDDFMDYPQIPSNCVTRSILLTLLDYLAMQFFHSVINLTLSMLVNDFRKCPFIIQSWVTCLSVTGVFWTFHSLPGLLLPLSKAFVQHAAEWLLKVKVY